MLFPKSLSRLYLAPDKGTGSSTPDSPSNPTPQPATPNLNQPPDTAGPLNNQKIYRPPAGDKNNMVPFSRIKPNITNTSGAEVEMGSASQTRISSPSSQIPTPQPTTSSPEHAYKADPSTTPDNDHQEIDKLSQKLDTTDPATESREQAKIDYASVHAAPEKLQTGQKLVENIEVPAPASNDKTGLGGKGLELSVDLSMHGSKQKPAGGGGPNQTMSRATRNSGAGKDRSQFQKTSARPDSTPAAVKARQEEVNSEQTQQAQIADQLEKDSPYYTSQEDEAKIQQEANNEVAGIGAPFNISPEEEAKIQQEANSEVAGLSNELSPEQEAETEQEAKQEASSETPIDLLSNDEIIKKHPNLRFTRLGDPNHGDVLNLGEGSKLPAGYVPPSQLNKLDKNSVQNKFDKLNENGKNLLDKLENSKDEKDVDKNKLLSDLNNYKMQQLNDLLKDKIKQRAYQFVATTAAPLIPWIAGALIGIMLLTGAFIVVLYYYCNYYRNIITDTAIRASNIVSPIDININQICDLFGANSGGSNACPANTTAFVKDPNGKWVADTTSSGDSFTSLCLEETLQGKSDNDTINLWRAQGGVSETPVPVRVIREVIAAGKEAGVSSEVVAFVLSKVATESLNAKPPLWQARNDIPCYGIVQVCAGRRGGRSYESWTRKTLGRVPSPEEFWDDPVMQMKVIATGVEEKKSFRCPYTEGKSSAFDIGVKWLGCVPLNSGDGGVTAGNYGEAVERNFKIITCSGTSTLVQNKSIKNNTLNLQNLIQPVATNAQSSAKNVAGYDDNNRRAAAQGLQRNGAPRYFILHHTATSIAGAEQAVIDAFVSTRRPNDPSSTGSFTEIITSKNGIFNYSDRNRFSAEGVLNKAKIVGAGDVDRASVQIEIAFAPQNGERISGSLQQNTFASISAIVKEYNFSPLQLLGHGAVQPDDKWLSEPAGLILNPETSSGDNQNLNTQNPVSSTAVALVRYIRSQGSWKTGSIEGNDGKTYSLADLSDEDLAKIIAYNNLKNMLAVAKELAPGRVAQIEEAMANISNISADPSAGGGALCCPPNVDPNEDASSCFAPSGASVGAGASGAGADEAYPLPLQAGEYAIPHFNIYFSPYGMRKSGNHKGIDISGPPGPVYAVDEGEVFDVETGCPPQGFPGSKCGGGFGNRIYIRHPNGDVTRYAHNTKLYVSLGQKVQKGQPIAQSGNSGSSGGVHLHFEHLKGGSNHINPCSEILKGKCPAVGQALK